MTLDLQQTLIAAIVLAGAGVVGAAGVLAYEWTRPTKPAAISAPEPRRVQTVSIRPPSDAEVRVIPTTQAQEFDVMAALLSTVGQPPAEEPRAEPRVVRSEEISARRKSKSKRRAAKRTSKGL